MPEDVILSDEEDPEIFGDCSHDILVNEPDEDDIEDDEHRENFDDP